MGSIFGDAIPSIVASPWRRRKAAFAPGKADSITDSGGLRRIHDMRKHDAFKAEIEKRRNPVGGVTPPTRQKR
jgi:hypothetical protein